LLGREDASYQQVADALSLSLGALKTAIHRLRGRYRALLREEVARTVEKPSEVDEELRFLRAALRG
jgi:DNA-directed RNA polymerase specialized sigma24 family protein